MFMEIGLGVAATLTTELLIAHFFLWKNSGTANTATSNTATSFFGRLVADGEGAFKYVEDEAVKVEQAVVGLFHKATPVPSAPIVVTNTAPAAAPIVVVNATPVAVPTNVNPAG